MADRLWAFADACEAAQSSVGVRRLLGRNLRALGFERFLLTTHDRREDLRSLAVRAHNWPDEAVAHFCETAEGYCNPLMFAIERSREDIVWGAEETIANLDAEDLSWLRHLQANLRGNGVSRAIRCVVVQASCSIVSLAPLRQDKVDLAMRMANHAFHHIQFLQRPTLAETEKLTAREQECLYRAAVLGERPAVVARKLGIKATTLRTLRQNAKARLDAGSPEQTIWHMLETGQLFRRGRKTKPRTS